MKLTLTLTGTASQLATVLASLPADVVPMPDFIPNAPAPMSPAPLPVVGAADEDSGPVNTTAPAFDADSLPWDGRIHAATKAVTEGGNWRKRRGVAKETIAAVEAELRARILPGASTVAPVIQPAPVMQMPAGDNPAPVIQPAPIMQMPAGDNAMQPAPVVQMPAMTVYAPAPVIQPAPVVQPTPTGALDFSGFMQHLSVQMAQRDVNGAPLIHADYLASVTAEISTAFGVQLTAITDITTDPAKISYAVQIMQRDGRW